MFCSQCGNRVTDPSARFCIHCGQPLPTATLPKVSTDSSSGPSVSRAIGDGSTDGLHEQVSAESSEPGASKGTTKTDLLARVGLHLGRAFDTIVKRPLTSSGARTGLIVAIVLSGLYTALSLNHLLALSEMGRNILLHLIEFGLIVALLVTLILAVRMQNGWQRKLQIFVQLLVIMLALNLVQNTIEALTSHQVLLLLVAVPLNVVVTTAIYLPALFVWTRTLLGQPSE